MLLPDWVGSGGGGGGLTIILYVASDPLPVSSDAVMDGRRTGLVFQNCSSQFPVLRRGKRETSPDCFVLGLLSHGLGSPLPGAEKQPAASVVAGQGQPVATRVRSPAAFQERGHRGGNAKADRVSITEPAYLCRAWRLGKKSKTDRSWACSWAAAGTQRKVSGSAFFRVGFVYP